MNPRQAKWVWLAPLSMLAVLATATPAWAADPAILELQAPKQVSLGEEVEVTAVLREGNGTPITGAAIVFSQPASFLSKEGDIELDRANTDAQGMVKFLYQARREGAVTLNAYFPGDSRYSPAQASTNLTVVGSTQLYQETTGVRLPGIGVWLLVVILGGVWSTYFAVMLFLTLIAREGSKASVQGGAHE